MKVKAVLLAAIVSPMIGFSQNLNSSINSEQMFAEQDQTLYQLFKYTSEWKVKRLNELPNVEIQHEKELKNAFKSKNHFLLEAKEFLSNNYNLLMSRVDAQELGLKDLLSLDEIVDFDLTIIKIEGQICGL